MNHGTPLLPEEGWREAPGWWEQSRPRALAPLNPDTMHCDGPARRTEVVALQT